MAGDFTRTMRLVRRSKVVTNDVGGTVWVDSVEPVELELVSTMMLEVMMDTDEDETRRQLKQLPEDGEGVLAHDPKRSEFQVVHCDEIEAALSGNAGPSTPNPDLVHDDDELELSLVSTQMIKVMLDHPELSPQEVSEEVQLIEEIESAGGFDPYNNG
ncbi:MAG: hypothetical protein AB8F65_08555 [Woeseiaceae bacterium]